ncbi:MAG: histone deacetylase [Planctomycetes bacterium]|nr:histone deacetylase [Planctomycetota bacterium]
MAAMLIYDNIYLEHDTGPHPENQQRLISTCEHLKTTGMWNQLLIKKPRKASEEELLLVHTARHCEIVKTASLRGGGYLDPDTVVSKKSYEAALFAAGGVLTAIDSIVKKDSVNAFCMVRPPGHHATSDRAMGFCLFNNAAIGARYAQKKHGMDKIAIFDWDVHHGNGTQDIFYEDPSVLYFSIHRFPFYPGSGETDETGAGKGKGFTINKPFYYGTTRDDMLKKTSGVLTKQFREFKPDLIIISAGFDGYKNDPVGGMGLEIEDYKKMTRMAVEAANECCEGRMVSTLEGGYDLHGLPLCIEAHLKSMNEV